MNQMLPKYRDKRTARFAAGERVKEFQGFARQAEKRLDVLRTANSIHDLMVHPSNQFKALDGSRKGQFSVRINDQWRICFMWPEWSMEALNIEIVDYHQEK